MASADAQTGLSLALAGPALLRALVCGLRWRRRRPNGNGPPHRRDWRDE